MTGEHIYWTLIPSVITGVNFDCDTGTVTVFDNAQPGMFVIRAQNNSNLVSDTFSITLTQNSDPVISPASASFDKNVSAQSDISLLLI